MKTSEELKKGWWRAFLWKLEICCRWQFRCKVFKATVVNSIKGDIQTALKFVLFGMAGLLVFVLTIPARLIQWVLGPIYAIISIGPDHEKWHRVEAAFNQGPTVVEVKGNN